MISKWDIDPKTVSRDDVTAEGYYAFILDESGNRTYTGQGELVTEWHEWPEGAGKLIYEMYLKESANEA
jgi:hypothetical protein